MIFKNQKDKNENRQIIYEVADAAGWSRQQAKKQMREAEQRLGVSFSDYKKLKLYSLSEEEQEEKYRKELKRRKLRKEREAKVAEAAGWTKEEAAERMADARKRIGVSGKVYLDYGFYRMSEEEQLKTYFKLIRSEEVVNPKHNVMYMAAVLSAVDANGWTYAEAKKDLAEVKKKYGLNNREYYLNKVFLITDEAEREKFAETVMREREIFRENKEALELEEEEDFKEEMISVAMKETGWTREQVLADYEDAYERTGVEYRSYRMFRFWELDKKTQSEYMHSAINKSLVEKYRKYTPRLFRTTAFYKDLCNEFLEDHLSRKWMSTIRMDKDSFMETFAGDDMLFYKPRTGFSGRGIKVYELYNGKDLEEAFRDISSLPFGVVEARLEQHHLMAQFSRKSVNTVRFVTIRTTDPECGIETGKTHFVYCSMKMNAGHSYLDNLHQEGGLVAAVDMETGTLPIGAVDENCNLYLTHPVTNVSIKGFKIPFFKEAIEMIRDIHEENDIKGYFGWDVAITENGPAIIELNNQPGTGLLQDCYAPLKKGVLYILKPYL